MKLIDNRDINESFISLVSAINNMFEKLSYSDKIEMLEMGLRFSIEDKEFDKAIGHQLNIIRLLLDKTMQHCL